MWTDLHQMPCKLAITLPELVEGEVHAAVVDQVPGDGQWVSLGNAILQQALAQNYHEPLPVATRHLREKGERIKVQFFSLKRKSMLSVLATMPEQKQG